MLFLIPRKLVIPYLFDFLMLRGILKMCRVLLHFILFIFIFVITVRISCIIVRLLLKLSLFIMPKDENVKFANS